MSVLSIVNQVLVRLWARCLVGGPRERAPSSHAPAQVGVRGSRSLTGQGLVMGNHGWVQPSDRRHMCSEAFLTGWLVVMPAGPLCAS